MKKLLMGAALLLGTAASAQGLLINGAGATFPRPSTRSGSVNITSCTRTLSSTTRPSAPVAASSSSPRATVDFGASDAPMKDDQIAKASDVVHIPTVLGAVVVVYNAPGLKSIRFSGETLANIFLGKITKWNDPAVAADNPGVKLPDQSIVIARRSDGSGTNAIFTDYLAKVSPEFKSKVAPGPA
jgi:phosphate transport system substrate-binding protein